MTFAALALTERIRSTFQNAFSGVDLGRGMSIRQSEATDHYGEGYTAQEYEDLPKNEVTSDWQRVPLEELERACVGHFDAHAYRYYIPALAMSVIEHYDGTSMRVIGTLMSLQRNDHYARMYELLNAKQKAAIALFLAHAPEVVPFRFNEEAEVSASRLAYWDQYLARAAGA
jgi:hypothetical protein